MKSIRKPTLLESLIPIVFLIFFLSFNVLEVFDNDSISGANQVSLLLAAAVASLVAYRIGMTWDKIQDGMVNSVQTAMPAIFILLIIGALVGTWVLSGIVPAMVYYGLQILSPSYFLIASCIICAVVSVATGSSWTTIATVGAALLGVGNELGISSAMSAGAIISGAYFGDKMSPLSDTTNLAPAMAGTDLFTHIKYMAYTTVPSFVITLIIFLLIGFSLDSSTTSTESVDAALLAIGGTFNITPWLFVAPVLVGFLIAKKIPALPALFIGTLIGALFAILFQGELLDNLAKKDGTIARIAFEKMDKLNPTQEEINFFVEEKSAYASYVPIMKSLYEEIDVKTGNENIDSEGLLKGKGMGGMLSTIWLIICAMIFGGVMDSSGMLRRISSSIVKLAKSTGSLIAATTTTCVVFNLTASDQYLAIVVPGRMYADTFRERNLAPENLSRTLEDAGTVTSVLIPWNTCGAFQSTVLGVATGEYFMYCFFNMISPIMTMIFGFAGIKIRKLDEAEGADSLK